MKTLLSSILIFCISASTVLYAADESEIEAGSVAECVTAVALTLLKKQNEGWACDVSTNTGTCTKDGVRAIIYCNGTKIVINMAKI